MKVFKTKLLRVFYLALSGGLKIESVVFHAFVWPLHLRNSPLNLWREPAKHIQTEPKCVCVCVCCHGDSYVTPSTDVCVCLRGVSI